MSEKCRLASIEDPIFQNAIFPVLRIVMFPGKVSNISTEKLTPEGIEIQKTINNWQEWRESLGYEKFVTPESLLDENK